FTKPLIITKPGATTATVPGLYEPTAAYRFVVRARDAAENSDDNIVNLTSRAGTDTTPPRFDGCKTAVSESAGSVVLTWSPAFDDTTPFDKIAYDIFAARDEGQFDFTTPIWTEVANASAHVDGLASNTLWHFTCRARDYSGNRDTNIIE